MRGKWFADLTLTDRSEFQLHFGFRLLDRMEHPQLLAKEVDHDLPIFNWHHLQVQTRTRQARVAFKIDDFAVMWTMSMTVLVRIFWFAQRFRDVNSFGAEESSDPTGIGRHHIGDHFPHQLGVGMRMIEFVFERFQFFANQIALHALIGRDLASTNECPNFKATTPFVPTWDPELGVVRVSTHCPRDRIGPNEADFFHTLFW